MLQVQNGTLFSPIAHWLPGPPFPIFHKFINLNSWKNFQIFFCVTFLRPSTSYPFRELKLSPDTSSHHFRSSIFLPPWLFFSTHHLSVCCHKCNFVKLLLRPFQPFFTLSFSIPSDSPTSFHISHEQKYQFPTFKQPLLISNIFRYMLFLLFFHAAPYIFWVVSFSPSSISLCFTLLWWLPKLVKLVPWISVRQYDALLFSCIPFFQVSSKWNPLSKDHILILDFSARITKGL